MPDTPDQTPEDRNKAETSAACCLPSTRQRRAPIAPDTDYTTKLNSRLTLDAFAELDGGPFTMGADDPPHPEDGESPARQVIVAPFAIKKTTVTNLEFQQFVSATAYITDAEQHGTSFVFEGLLHHDNLSPAITGTPWWRDVTQANWKNPLGPDSPLADYDSHPVVHVSRRDVLAFCAWSGTRLPTEAEWEFAARGGLTAQPYPCGERLTPDSQYLCNIWQGEFPTKNTGADGFIGTAPANSYTPNNFGLLNMVGNVWEWVEDRFTHLHSPRPASNPKGPLNGEKFVAKGGSYLCHHSYCLRYRTSSRQALLPGTCTGNLRSPGPVHRIALLTEPHLDQD